MGNLKCGGHGFLRQSGNGIADGSALGANLGFATVLRGRPRVNTRFTPTRQPVWANLVFARVVHTEDGGRTQDSRLQPVPCVSRRGETLCSPVLLSSGTKGEHKIRPYETPLIPIRRR